MTSSAREGPEQAGPLAAGAPRHWALVPCAGVGARAGTPGPKQYTLLRGRPLVAWTLAALDDVPEVDAVLVVLAPEDTQFDGQDDMRAVRAGARPVRKPLHVARCGGATRAQSVANGLEALCSLGAVDHDWVLVHDAARCLVHPESVSRLVAACADDAVGGLLALPVPDTLKRARAGTSDPVAVETPVDRVAATLSREAIWAAQTPQMFRLGLLREALRRALAHDAGRITDESSAMEAMGFRPRLVRGDYENLKVTWPEDFALAERLLRGRGDPARGGSDAGVSDTSTVHRSEAP